MGWFFNIPPLLKNIDDILHGRLREGGDEKERKRDERCPVSSVKNTMLNKFYTFAI